MKKQSKKDCKIKQGYNIEIQCNTKLQLDFIESTLREIVLGMNMFYIGSNNYRKCKAFLGKRCDISESNAS